MSDFVLVVVMCLLHVLNLIYLLIYTRPRCDRLNLLAYNAFSED